VGLIAKAVKKVEKKESLSVEQDTPPKSEGKKIVGKKKAVIAVTALLFVGTSLGLGYLFLLKPTSEVAPKVVRRSISARKKPGKPATPQSEQKKDTGAGKAKVERKEIASGKASEKTIAPKETPEKVGMPVEEKEKTSMPESEPPIQITENQISKVKEETETAKLLIEKPQGFIVSKTSEKQEKRATDVTPSEGTKEDSKEHISDRILSAEPEEMPPEEITPVYLAELEREWSRKALVVTERSESRAERYHKKGATYHQQGELNRAIDSYKEALTFNPDHLKARMNLATAYLQIGRFKEAEQELFYLYAIKPKDLKILFNFGLLLYQTGQHTSAEIKLKKLLEVEPFHLETILLLASIYEERGELGKALESCMKAYRINSADPRVLYRLGRAWDLVGEAAKATKYYQLFLKVRSEKENQLELAVRDRLKYLTSEKEEK